MGYNVAAILLKGSELLVFLGAAFFWGNWRNWKHYYPTILFVICMDFLASILMYHHTLWKFEGFLILPNHTLTDFLFAFMIFPAIVLTFLSRYPEKWITQMVWILAWVFVLSLSEYISKLIGTTTYHNGWNFGWSVLFNSITFPIMRLHHSRPLFAWLIGIPIAVFILVFFHFSIEEMK